jgi:DNA modification methylase
MPKLDFEGQPSLHGAHALHPYAAKCPPQLVRYGLTYFSKRGDTVLDPMSGSGTTLVESKLMGRSAHGVDLDPLARLISKVKCCPIEDREIAKFYGQLSGLLLRSWSRTPLPKSFEECHNAGGPNVAAWFSPDVAQDLMRIVAALTDLDAPLKIRQFFWVAFSSLILARTSVANARDIIHSRAHRFDHAKTPQPIQRFHDRVARMRIQMKEFYSSLDRNEYKASVTVSAGDARSIPLDDDSVDLVFTSPPYATALDYPRAHFLAVAWMEPILGMSLADYLKKAPDYIGSVRGRFQNGSFEVMPELTSKRVCSNTLESLSSSCHKQAKVVQRYFLDMSRVMEETTRVLKKGRKAIVVVCPSHIRKVSIPTDEILIELGRGAGLLIKARHQRTIDRRRRLLPYMDGNTLGARMSLEYVLVFQK